MKKPTMIDLEAADGWRYSNASWGWGYGDGRGDGYGDGGQQA